jgi:CelD/BcsL family acetyltransferase involved in cellulose biosynthesis
MILTTTDPSCISRDPRALGREWSELARRRARPVVFLTPQWLAVARAHDPREQLTFAVGDPAVGVIALARDDVGAVSFAGGELTDEQDVLAPAGQEELAARALAGWLATNAGPRVLLEYVPEDVPTVSVVAGALRGRGYAVRQERLVTAPRVQLAPDFETFVQGLTKKERHELRRKIRRLESGREVTFRFATDAERSAVLDRFVALHRLSRGEKATFMTAERERFFRDMADALAAPGWLRLGVLRVDGEDAAVLYAFAYARTLALYNAAYDPALAPLSVGIVCHAYAIREAIAERLATYDLLRGDEPYKYDLGAEDHWLMRLEATRP